MLSRRRGRSKVDLARSRADALEVGIVADVGHGEQVVHERIRKLRRQLGRPRGLERAMVGAALGRHPVRRLSIACMSTMVYMDEHARGSREHCLTVAGLRGLRDRGAVARIDARLRGVSPGNPGDARAVGGGLFEMRIHRGPGYHLCLLREEATVVMGPRRAPSGSGRHVSISGSVRGRGSGRWQPDPRRPERHCAGA